MAIKGELCCGCGLCSRICPKQAISMVQDEMGFWKPSVDMTLCVECGLCEKQCVSNGQELAPPREVLAYRGPDELRRKATSGGAFLAVSERILQNGGVVYGAAYGPDFTLRHIRGTDAAVRDLFCGSKYAQSDMGETYPQVAADLLRLEEEQGNGQVLFTGTPCQTAAMYRYVCRSVPKAARERLVLMDFICSGTPSGKLFREYIGYVQKKRKKTVTAYAGRSKDTGWQRSCSKLSYSDGSAEVGTPLAQAYQTIYGLNLADHDMCYQCPYVSGAHVSDLTVGDFWGVDKAMPEFNDKKGISLVFVNTDKGGDLFRQAIEGVGDTRPLTMEQAKQRNHFAQHKIPAEARREFREAYGRRGVEGLLRTYGQMNVLGSAKRAVKKFIDPDRGGLAVKVYVKLRTAYTRLRNR